jgi:L-2-hydroxycarboxylate dehydrogenase (NAD+)
MTAGDPVAIDVQPLSAAMQSAFEACGVGADDARWTVQTLLDAQIEGATGHGLVRFPTLVERLNRGLTNPAPDLTIIRETAGTALVDGDNGLGQVVGARCMDLAVVKARDVGVAYVTVRESNHFGRGGDYALRATGHGMIGVVFSSASPRLVQAPGARRFLGNNPLAMAVPGRSHPVLIDIAPAAATVGSIRLAAVEGRRLPEGVALDARGRDTTDPKAALDGGMFGVGGHKGWIYALLVELLTGVMAGGASGDRIGPSQVMDRRQRTCHAMLAIDADALIGLDALFDGLDDLRSGLGDAAGGQGRLPGDRRAGLERPTTIELSARLYSAISDALAAAGVHDVSVRPTRE